MTPVSSHSPHGQSSLRTVQVLGGGNAGSSTHVRSLAAGLVARGVKVTVCAPSDAEYTYDFTGAGADHVPVPRSSDPVSVAALRTVCADADLERLDEAVVGLARPLGVPVRAPQR